MADAADIKQAIIDSAVAGVSETSVDGTTVRAMDIEDQIKAAEYTKANEAASKPARGLRFSQLIPPGCL